MLIKLKIKSKPISTNSAYYSRNKKFNENSRIWRHNFLSELQSDYNQNQISQMKKYFNSKKHMLRVTFHWYQPIDLILTKSGELSLRSMDVDNCLKIPTDCVFDKKYNDKWLSLCRGKEKTLYKSMKSLVNLDINDKFIFDTRSIKCPSTDGQFHCLVEIEAVPLFQRV